MMATACTAKYQFTTIFAEDELDECWNKTHLKTR